MSYPTTLPSYLGFTSTHTLAADQHASQHNSAQADIIALATKVGLGGSTPASNTVMRATGAGTSNWDTVHAATDISGTLPTTIGGTGTSSTTGTGSVVFGTSPTLTTPTLTTPAASGGTFSGNPSFTGQPTIGDLTNANHTHLNTVGGGSLGTAAVLPAMLSSGLFQGVAGLSQSAISSSSATDVSGSSVVFTPAVASYMYIWYGGDIQLNIALDVNLFLNIDGANVQNIETENNTATRFHIPACRLYKAALTAASHTIKLQVSSTSPSNSALNAGFWYGLLVSQ